jgi:hypothetical protein
MQIGKRISVLWFGNYSLDMIPVLRDIGFKREALKRMAAWKNITRKRVSKIEKLLSSHVIH